MANSKNFDAIVPNDSADIEVCDAIYVGTAGTLTLQNPKGVNIAFAVAAGQLLQVSPKRVMATGTDVTGLVALYKFTS